MQFHRLRDFAARLLRILMFLLLWYLSCYFLTMDWRVVPYDPVSEVWAGESCYYLARMVRVPGDFSIFTGSTSWANWLFRPLDSLLYGAKAAMDCRVFQSGLWVIWGALFGVNLLLPFFSIILRGGQSLKDHGVRILLSLLAAGWYCGLIFLYHLTRQEIVNVFLGKFLAVVGTVVAVAALYWIAHARGYVFVVPLAVVTVLGTIWLLVSLPCVTPYM